MRTTLLQAARQTLFNLRQAQARKAEATLQVSSGRRVSKPSDSPADAADVVRSLSALDRLEQFRFNLQSVRSELQAVDGALAQTANALTRALTLAAQAASDTQNADTRALIQEEIEGIFRHVVSLANSQHAGRFVFAGNTDDEAPFVPDETSPDGVLYRGDSENRSVTFPDGRPAPVSLPGDAVFVLPDAFTGSGRTADTSGAAPPSPPLGVGVSFTGEAEGVISADLDRFFVAAAPPGVPAGGEQIRVTFTSADGSVSEAIETDPLAGGEDAAQIAALLNGKVAANPELAGGFLFSEEGGRLKLVQTETPGQGCTFTSSATGGLVTGLETGGALGGQSAAEIAAALNEQAAQNPALSGAGVRFSAVDGEVQVDADVDVTFTAVDFNRGTAFASGLAGTHRAGGERSANVLGSLNQLIAGLAANNEEGIRAGVDNLQRAVAHIGRAQGFFGATLRQTELTLESVSELTVVNQQRLSSRRDADLIEAASELASSSTAEQFALAVAARQQPNLLDLLA